MSLNAAQFCQRLLLRTEVVTDRQLMAEGVCMHQNALSCCSAMTHQPEPKPILVLMERTHDRCKRYQLVDA